MLNNIFIIISVVFVTAVIIEASFRLKLFLYPRKLRICSIPLLNVIAPPHIEFNEDTGYNFIKNTNSARITFKYGEPVFTTFWEINDCGNVGFDTIPCNSNSHYKIAVFGDSFTECSGGVEGGRTWPDYLKSIIRDSTSLVDLKVINFGRGGYGILQMFDLMRLTIEKLTPDLIIFAFISDDLDRDRFWYSQLKTGNLNRFVVSNKSEFDQRSSDFVDIAYFLDAEQKDWLLENSSHRKQSHPNWLEVERELNRINIQRVRNFRFLFKVDSLLWNLIIFGTPFPHHKYERFDGNPRMRFDNFTNDKRLLQNIEFLRNTAIPFEIINIPEHTELCGRAASDIRIQNLRTSLEEAIGQPIANFRDYPRIPSESTSPCPTTLILHKMV